MNKEINPSKIMRGMKFYSVEDLSEILGITRYAVRDNLRKSKIGGVKVGKRWWVSDKNLNAFLNTGAIFDKPEKVILDTIKEGIEQSYKQNVEDHFNKLMKDFSNKIDKKIEEIQALKKI